MLPPSLHSVYQQYKEDTNAVASWLASTAKSRGYPADLLSGAPSQDDSTEQSKRLKGKARKQAKAVAEQAQGCSSSPDYTIAIRNFIPLAEFVAACQKPTVTVPVSFANTLNRVISARSGFRSRLAEFDDSQDISADSKHSYFVGVLEKVRGVLTPRLSPASRDTAKPQAPSWPDSVGEVGGRFAGLTVDEPSEKFLNAPDIKRPVPVKNDNSTYVAESLQDPVEVSFAYNLLLNDLAMIRNRIEWLWISYHNGPLELVSAALATNTACDLARHLMEDMAPMFKACGGAIEIATRHYRSRCKDEGLDCRDVRGMDFNYQTYQIATDTYMVGFVLLENFLKTLDPRQLPVYIEGIPAIYDPTRVWSEMSNLEKFQQDESLAGEFFAELAIIIRCFPSYPVHDEVIRGMRELDRTREIPMYLAFAVQIFLDIHHILRGKVYSGQQTCMSNLTLMDEDLALHMDFHANIRNKGSRSAASIDESMKEIRKQIKWIQDDHPRETKVKLNRKAGILCTAPMYRLFQLSPVISGLMLYQLRASMYKIGLTVANAWGSVTSSQHLYNALKQEQILIPGKVPMHSWDDAIVSLTLLGKESFFVGSEVPRNPEDYLKKACLQMGMSAVAFSNSNDKRLLKRKGLTSKNGPRHIKHDCCPVTDMFFDRYMRNTGQVDWTPEYLDRVLSRALCEEEGEQDDGGVLLGQIKDPEKLRERKRNMALVAAGKKDAAARLPPEQLIRSLAFALQMESLTMAFPYLALHRAVWGILREVRDACEPLMLELYGPGHMIKENELPSVVLPILSELLGGDDRLFVKAGEVVKEQFLQCKGAEAMHRMRDYGFVVAGPRNVGAEFSQPGTFFIVEYGTRNPR